jgi:hypothetical protein
MLAKHALYQLSYGPEGVSVHFPGVFRGMVGPGRLELPTSRLSGVRSNQLSYGPLAALSPHKPITLGSRSRRGLDEAPSTDGRPTGGDEGKRNEDGGSLHL